MDFAWPDVYPATQLKLENPLSFARLAVKLKTAEKAHKEIVSRADPDIVFADPEESDARVLEIEVFATALASYPNAASATDKVILAGQGKRLLCAALKFMIDNRLLTTETTVFLDACSVAMREIPAAAKGLFQEKSLAELVLQAWDGMPTLLSRFVKGKTQFRRGLSQGPMFTTELRARERDALAGLIASAAVNESLVRYYEAFGFIRLQKEPDSCVLMISNVSKLMETCMGSGFWSGG